MRVLKKKKIIIILLLTVLIAFCWFQNNYITVSRYLYESSKVTGQTEGYTIVHISDLHNKMFGSGQKRLISRVASCHPDIIVVTGDIVDRSRTDIDKAVVFIEEAVKLAPVYYVTGNHERDLPADQFKELTSRIEQAGAVWLDNETVEITAAEGQKVLGLTGLDNDSLQNTILQQMPNEVDRNYITVLLAHQPQFIGLYSQLGPDIVFSGHAHGGQFRLPFIGGVIAPGQGLFPEYTEGAHTMGDTTMYVSRGLGNSIFPLRLFNCPEVVCVEIL